MTMTNANVNKPNLPISPNPTFKPTPLSAEQLTAINDKAKEIVQAQEDPTAGMAEEFNENVEREAKIEQKKLQEAIKEQLEVSGKSIKDLTESDAYDFSVQINAGTNFNPELLKVVLKDPNYIARWANRDHVRQAQMIAKGFKMVQEEEVSNIDTLEMFLDSQGHFVYSDLVCMKIRKDVYYAGLRRAYVKSLHATNNKKAAEAGGAYAKSNLNSTLTGAERNYVAQHENQGTNKPIYNPVIGV